MTIPPRTLSLGNLKLNPIGEASVEKLPDGRKRITRRWEVISDLYRPDQIEAQCFQAWLTPDGQFDGSFAAAIVGGRADVHYPTLLLVDQGLGAPRERQAKAVLWKVYEEIGATPSQVGPVEAGMAGARAYVDTNGSGKIVGGTRFAREWTVRFTVTGDVTASDGQWLAVNSPRTFGARTGYHTTSALVAQANGVSMFTRTYTELPSRLVYDRPTRYPFPGTLGIQNGVPYGIPGATRQVPMEIEETYHVGEVAAQAIEFEVLSWAAGTVNFTTAGNTGSKGFSFTGCIGELTITGSNNYFAGYLCTALAGVISSNPATYPTGKKRIASDTSPWKGDIWKRTNAYITFP